MKNGSLKVKGSLMSLSSRQRDMLAMIAHGLTDKEIAIKLKISEKTVESHISKLLGKLKARNRAHALFIYLKIKFPQIRKERFY